jgi:hypothetical protein
MEVSVKDQVNSTSAEGEEQPQPAPTTEPEGEEGAVVEPAEGAGKAEVGEEEATPKPRVYSEEEWNKRQSSVDKQVAELQRRNQEELTKIRQEHEDLLARERERHNQEFLAKVEAEGGDVEAAKRIIAKEEATIKREAEIAQREQALLAYQSQVDEALKAVAANKLASQYGVDATELLKAQNPLEMENIALKLHAEKLKAGAKRPIKTDSSIPSARGVDLSKLSPSEKVKRGLGDMNI